MTGSAERASSRLPAAESEPDGVPHADSGTERLDVRQGKREALLRAAVELWSERGFDHVTVAELCEAAGVSKGSFYAYFRHKESLLVDVGLDATQAIFDESFDTSIEGLGVESVLDRVVVALGNGLQNLPQELVSRYLVEARRFAEARDDDDGGRGDLAAVLMPVFGRAIRRGEVDSRFGPGELGGVCSSVLVNGILAWAQGRDGGLGLEDVLRRRVELMLNGALLRDAAPSVPRPVSTLVYDAMLEGSNNGS